MKEILVLLSLICLLSCSKTEHVQGKALTQATLNEEKKNVQEKFNKQAQCLKSQKVDILKDSVRFKFVFDSCWVEYMHDTNNH